MYTLQQLQACSDPRIQELTGKSILVSLWQYDDGNLISQSQEYGEIIGYDQNLQIQTPGGEKFFYPANYEAMIPAPRGKYTLRTTGQEILNPDLLLSWRVDIVDPIEESTWQANTAPHVYSIVEKEWDFETAYDGEYNRYLAETRGHELVGKSILIGVSFYRSENGVTRFDHQTQEFGVVTHVSFGKGVLVQLRDGSIFTLPPDIAMIQRAPEGEYELQSSGEVITNPDFITQWRITSESPVE